MLILALYPNLLNVSFRIKLTCYVYHERMKKMKVLWLCNLIIPMVSDALGIEGPSVGGWMQGQQRN